MSDGWGDAKEWKMYEGLENVWKECEEFYSKEGGRMYGRGWRMSGGSERNIV